MIPIRDHNPSGKFPFVTYFLIGVNIFVFLYMFFLPENQLENFIYSFALVPAFVKTGQNLFSFLTSMFLHGSFGHLFGNMLFLNIFGDNLEDKLGRIRYLIFYFLSGFGASLLQILVKPFSEIPMLGASGAVAGVMGGYLFLFPRHRIDVLFSSGWYLRRATLPAYTMLFYWFFFQLIYGLGSLGLPQLGGIAYFAHIGGFLTGLGIVLFLKRSRVI